MNFNEFTDEVVALLKEKMGSTCTVTVTEVLKNNNVRLTGIVIKEETCSIAPTVYLETPYKRYQEGISLEVIAEEIRDEYEKYAHNLQLDMDFFKDFAQVKGGIFHKVINYEKNKELLKDVPYIKWHDLVVVFYYAMEEAVFGKATILLYNSHLAMWGQTVDEIYRIAQQNMKQKMPELLVSMKELMEELAGIEVDETIQPLYMLSNREKMFGASAMLYSEKIKGLADRLGSDLLILPSSTHCSGQAFL